jgi:hypothetical protein
MHKRSISIVLDSILFILSLLRAKALFRVLGTNMFGTQSFNPTFVFSESHSVETIAPSQLGKLFERHALLHHILL